MTPPIPRRMLTLKATVQVPAEADLGGEFAEPAELDGVAFEPAQEVRQTSWQLQDGIRGTMFVDAVNTKGAFRIPAGSLVTIEGAPPVAVTSCEEYAAFGRVHHWEVGLG